jgi:hypothetical protein
VSKRQLKVTAEQMKAIRESKEQPKVLAIDYGISLPYVYYIKNRAYYKNKPLNQMPK